LLFARADLTEQELDLQREVRAFLAAELPHGTFTPGLGMAAPRDRPFSVKLAQRGWLGMALPARYGGHDRSAVDRFVVSEELLRWGAPVGHHWVADRQSGPMINRFGSEEQKQRFLPAICRGQLSFAIGMSEPEAGSDLAAVRTRATAVDGGWVLNGTKVWTSAAHESDWFVVLCRTADDPQDRRTGLSQLIVDLRSEGLTISAIPFLSGRRDFNEVSLEDVFVPDDLVLGEIGGGWAQNISELAHERGGPERWLSTYLLVEELLRSHAELLGSERARLMLGDAVARWWAMRRLSLSVARMIDSGEALSVQSALVKEMGTRFEQDLLARVQALVAFEPLRDGDAPFERLLFEAVLSAPSFTIRGGTNEILRSVAAKGLGAL
jgi:3-oxocholest-4-en-26-oyl-CoA dehydrogenase alpha subunit